VANALEGIRRRREYKKRVQKRKARRKAKEYQIMRKKLDDQSITPEEWGKQYGKF
jgi:hypothetical protein